MQVTAVGPHEPPGLLSRIWPVDPKYSHTLFIPTGKRTFRLNWRNPLAAVLVVLALLLSPLLAVWAAVVFIAGLVDRWRRR